MSVKVYCHALITPAKIIWERESLPLVFALLICFERVLQVPSLNSSVDISGWLLCVINSLIKTRKVPNESQW